MFWKIAMIVLFFILTIGIGLYYRNASKSAGDFVLGGRNVGPWLSAFAYGTTYFSATIFIGYSGQFGWQFGVSSFWIGIGNALIGSLLAWVLLGRRTRIMTKSMDTATMPDFFAKRYNSSALKIAASVIIFVFLIPYSASVYKGLSGMFSICFGIDFRWCIVGMAVLTAIFVIAGGYMGTAVNNLIQGLIMLVGIVMMVVGVLNANGGFMNSLAMLSEFTAPAAPEMNGAYSSMFGPEPLNLVSVLLLTSLGTWGLPQMVHKFYAIKNEQAIRTGTLISTIFALVIAGGSYFIGAFGRLFWTEGEVVFDQIVPNMIEKSLPDYLIGIILLVVLSASISSLSSLVITSSSTFISDFMKSISKKNFSGKKELVAIKIMCAVFIIISVLIAVIPNSLITTLMSLSWGALAGAFLGPFIYGLFWKGATQLSVWISMISGVGIVVANCFIKFTTPTIAGAAAMILSLIIVPLVSIVTPRFKKEFTDKIFSCYDEKVVAPSIDVLEEE